MGHRLFVVNLLETKFTKDLSFVLVNNQLETPKFQKKLLAIYLKIYLNKV